jgi:hypothetical protein
MIACGCTSSISSYSSLGTRGVRRPSAWTLSPVTIRNTAASLNSWLKTRAGFLGIRPPADEYQSSPVVPTRSSRASTLDRPAVSSPEVGELLGREQVAPATRVPFPHLPAGNAQRVQQASQPADAAHPVPLGPGAEGL